MAGLLPEDDVNVHPAEEGDVGGKVAHAEGRHHTAPHLCIDYRLMD